MKKKLVLLLSLAIVLSVVYWLFTHATIEIAVSNSANGELTYTLLESGSQKTTKVKTDSDTIKKLVRKGSYEVLVQQGENSYFAAAKTGSFLSKTTIQANLKSEKSRRFVGDNPGPCTTYSGQTLISFGCDEPYNDAVVHVAPKANQSTYTQRVPSAAEGSVEGIVKTKEGSLILIKAPDINEDQGAPHTIYLLEGNGRLANGVALDLDEESSYSMRGYKEGFVVYDESFSDIFYYASRTSAPSRIALSKPTDQKLIAQTLSIYGDSLVVTYTNNPEGEVASLDEPGTGGIKSEFVVEQNNTVKHFTLDSQYSSVNLCGTNKLCLLNGNDELEVYDISSDKQKLMFKVSSVSAVENSGSGLIVVREKDILSLDVDKSEGSIELSLGDYTYCGLQVDGSEYNLCLINSRLNKVALRINQTQVNLGSIDKKISELLKLSEVKNVSIYEKFIFISPELGEVVFNEAIDSFDYDPNLKKAVSAKIDQAIDKLGIDRNLYKITNTLE